MKVGRKDQARASNDRTSRGGWTITQLWEAEFVPDGAIVRYPQSVKVPDARGMSRQSIFEPIVRASLDAQLVRAQ